MDFQLGDKAEQVRRDIREFLRREFTESERQQERVSGDGHNWSLYKKLAAAGWVSAGWPKEFGGGGRDPYEMLALYWELSKAGFPWFGLLNNGFIGHTLMAMGSEQQKTELVPRIAAGDVLIALGYTEPGSGSDVAAAKTVARPEGDDWIIDGQKMFTTTGHLAQYIFTLVRTGPPEHKHRSLTMFLVPTDAEGVEIHPIHTMGGERTNGVFFDGVRVPDALRVGEVDKGWSVVRFALGLEQAMGYADRQELFLEEAEAWTAGTEQSGEKGVLVRQQLAQMAINTEVSKLLRYRSTWEQAQGITGTASGPMTKAFSAVKYLQDARAWMDLQGPLAALERGAQQAPLQGAFAETYRAAPVTTIYGGTVEILRSVIAEVGLGLPKSR